MNLLTTLDWRDYTDAQRFEIERERCFAAAWHYVGTSCDLEAAGAQRATRALGVPVLLVRGDDEQLRAYVNACRHRGARLVDGSVCSRSISCPYHGWTYGLDGRLRAAPRLQKEAGTSPSELANERSLHELRLETWGPMLFVALDDTAPPLGEWLGPIPSRIAALGIEVDQLEQRHRTTGEIACNWKVVCENYLECYHCRIAHRDFCAVVDVDDDAYLLETNGRVATQVAPRRRHVERPGYDGSGTIERGEFHYVFPNLVAYVAPGPPVLGIGAVVPTAPDRTWRSIDYLAPAGLPAAELDELVAWDDRVGEEDRILVEAVQAGMAAACLVPRGVLMPDSERLVGWFAEQVRAATQADHGASLTT